LLFICLSNFGQVAIDLDKTYIDSTWTSIEVDTLFFDRDSVYITADGDTMIFVVDDVTGMYIASDGSNASVVITDTLKILDLASANTLVLTPTSTGNVDTLETLDLATADITVTGDWDFVNADVDTLIVNDTLYVGGNSMFDSTVSIGSWGYTGEHITIPEISSNTNAALGVYSMIDYAATAGKVFAGTYSRAVAMTTNQVNQSTMVGMESQFRLRNADIADGVHAGLWAYAEQSGTSELSGGGTFDAISATVESEAGFTVGATEHVTGITIDGSINEKAPINANANYSGIYIKSNGLDWFDGIKITGATNAIELQSAATIDNTETDTLTLTETVVKVDGDMWTTGTIDQTITNTAAGGQTGLYSYLSHGTNALTGELIGVHGNGRVNVNSAAGTAMGGKFQSGNFTAGYDLLTGTGVYVDVVNKIPAAASATWTNARGYEVSMDLDQGTAGHTNTVTNAQMFYGVYNLPTAGSYATVTNGYGVFLRNEAVGGTGQMIDAALYVDDKSHTGGIKGWDYGIDFSGIGANSGSFGTADIRFSNGALINNSDADNLDITEDTVTVNGVLNVTGDLTGMSIPILYTDATVVLTAALCKNKEHANNDAGAIDFTLPAAQAGLVVMFTDLAGGVITIDPFDGTDEIYLNGVSVGAGDEIDSPGNAGDFIVLKAYDDTRWFSLGRSGVWVDANP